MNPVLLPYEVFHILTQHALVQRLIFASIELVVAAGAVALFIRLLRIRTPRIRAFLWLLVLGKPIIGLIIGSPIPAIRFAAPEGGVISRGEVGSEIGSEAFLAKQSGDDRAEFEKGLSITGLLEPQPEFDPRLPHWVPSSTGSSSRFAVADFLVGSWLVGVVLLGGLTAWDRIRIRRLLRAAEEPSAALLAHVKAVANWMDIKRPPRLRITARLESPALVGSLRPVVLVPQWLAAEGDLKRLDWLLRHELTHWKHRDHWGLIVRRLAEVLFFFHPVVWWAGKKWAEAMELACDRALLQTDADANAYAQNLYRILKNRHLHRRFAMSAGLFATRTQIGRRIEALLADPLRSPARLTALSMTILTAVSVLGLSAGFGLNQGRGVRETAPQVAPEVAQANEVSADAAEPTGDVAQLVWGEPVNGLRAAVEFVPEKPSYRVSEGVDVRFHIENVNGQQIRFRSTTLREDAPVVFDEEGNEVVASCDRAGWVLQKQLYQLEAGERAILKGMGLQFGADDPPDDDGAPRCRAEFREAGRYLISYQLKFPNWNWFREGEADDPDDWEGILQTGIRGVIITPADEDVAGEDRSDEGAESERIAPEVYRKRVAGLVLPQRSEVYEANRKWVREHLAGSVPYLMEAHQRYPALNEFLFDAMKDGLLSERQKEEFIEHTLLVNWDVRSAYPPGYATEGVVNFGGVRVSRPALGIERTVSPFSDEGFLEARWAVEFDGKEIKRGTTEGHDGSYLQFPEDLRPGEHILKVDLEVSERSGDWSHAWQRTGRFTVDPELRPESIIAPESEATAQSEAVSFVEGPMKEYEWEHAEGMKFRITAPTITVNGVPGFGMDIVAYVPIEVEINGQVYGKPHYYGQFAYHHRWGEGANPDRRFTFQPSPDVPLAAGKHRWRIALAPDLHLAWIDIDVDRLCSKRFVSPWYDVTVEESGVERGEGESLRDAEQ